MPYILIFLKKLIEAWGIFAYAMVHRQKPTNICTKGRHIHVKIPTEKDRIDDNNLYYHSLYIFCIH